MSYSREWDSGKDWNQSDWNYQGNVHGRDGDDYYSADKRRKYNNYHVDQNLAIEK